MSTARNTKYEPVDSRSNHGLLFSIEDDEDVANDNGNENDDDPDEIEIVFDKSYGQEQGQAAAGTVHADSKVPQFPRGNELSAQSFFAFAWSTLTFAWMKPLLAQGHTRALEQSDLYPLQEADTAPVIYSRFRAQWTKELQKHAARGEKHADDDDSSNQPSLTSAFAGAFGWPFICAGLLKLVHDSCLFVGPLLLNSIINLLSDPSNEHIALGYYYVAGLFAANFMMSLCLRQYFWWCYRVGMNLRSAVITSVYNKALMISAASLHRQSTGQITNLMSVDASRLQDLTPYLHAIWYSLYQIIIAMYLLWQQMGPSCLAGIAVIVSTIPLTNRIAAYMKTLQKAMSSVRDERIKVSNEVLSGMKVIKLQAWENEYKKRIDDIRTRELATFRKYVISQALSGAVYTTIPLMVGICTFTAYIASGHTLTVATALTSLALFEILRFPLFMLPQVMNNIVEARVSLDRVQTFLMEPEKHSVPVKPLQQPGVLMDKSTLIWERTKCAKGAPAVAAPANLSRWQQIQAFVMTVKDKLTGQSVAAAAPSSSSGRNAASTKAVAMNPMWVAVPSADGNGGTTSFKRQQQTFTQSQIAAMSKDEYMEAVMHAQMWEAENRIEELEQQLQKERLKAQHAAENGNNGPKVNIEVGLVAEFDNIGLFIYVCISVNAADVRNITWRGRGQRRCTVTELNVLRRDRGPPASAVQDKSQGRARRTDCNRWPSWQREVVYSIGRARRHEAVLRLCQQARASGVRWSASIHSELHVAGQHHLRATPQ
jgi:ABC-type multidrug transport system fused ATPase/permease subunit